MGPATLTVSRILFVIGIIFLALGIIIVTYPSAVPLSPGLTVFGLGLALSSFALTQHSNYMARLTASETAERLARIEKLIEGISKS